MASLDQFTAQANEYMRRVGMRIRAGRLAQNLTQADLARACFAPSPTTIPHWEQGRAMPALPRQFAIADALELPMSVVWGHTDASDLVLENLLTARGAPASLTPTIQAGVRLRTAAVGSHYVSTECVHENHGDRCTMTCRFCDAVCRCWCHVIEPAASANGHHQRARSRAGEGL